MERKQEEGVQFSGSYVRPPDLITRVGDWIGTGDGQNTDVAGMERELKGTDKKSMKNEYCTSCMIIV